jgi:hypothetical protein
MVSGQQNPKGDANGKRRQFVAQRGANELGGAAFEPVGAMMEKAVIKKARLCRRGEAGEN